MGIRHLSLDLPAHLPAAAAEKTARTELRSRGVTRWTRLHLHSMSPTTQAGISTYLFAFWVPNDDLSGNTTGTPPGSATGR